MSTTFTNGLSPVHNFPYKTFSDNGHKHLFGPNVSTLNSIEARSELQAMDSKTQFHGNSPVYLTYPITIGDPFYVDMTGYTNGDSGTLSCTISQAGINGYSLASTSSWNGDDASFVYNYADFTITSGTIITSWVNNYNLEYYYGPQSSPDIVNIDTGHGWSYSNVNFSTIYSSMLQSQTLINGLYTYNFRLSYGTPVATHYSNIAHVRVYHV